MSGEPDQDPAEVRRRAAAHVFVDDLDALELSDADAAHLGRSLRLRPGESVTASDGRGSWRPTRWSGVGLEATGEPRFEPAPTPLLTVGFVLTKGDRPERVVRALTELGIDRLLLLTSARSVVRWDDGRATRNRERLERIVREAAMQSRRVHLPTVADVRPLATVIGPGVALADPGGSPVTTERPTLLVGPEGGWDPDERALGPLVSLGPSILRAETAAVAAGVLLTYLRDQATRSTS